MFDSSQIKKDLDAVIITVLISQSQFSLNYQLLANKACGGGVTAPISGMVFVPVWSEIFEGTTGVYERIYRVNSK